MTKNNSGATSPPLMNSARCSSQVSLWQSRLHHLIHPSTTSAAKMNRNRAAPHQTGRPIASNNFLLSHHGQEHTSVEETIASQLQIIPARKRKESGSKNCRSKSSPWNQQEGAGIGNTKSLSPTFRLNAIQMRKRSLREKISESGSSRLFICWRGANKG